jgi:anti-sigma factor RsiW
MTDDKRQSIPQLDELLSDLVDGQLTDEGRAKLCAMLRGNPAAQDAYRELIALHALLHLDFSQGQAQLLPPLVPSFPPTIPIDSQLGARSTGLVSRFKASWRRKMERPAWRLAGAAALLAASVLFVIWTLLPPGTLVGGGRSPAVAKTNPSSQPRRNANDRSVAPEVQAVAVLGQASRASWSDASLPVNNGASLKPGKFTLNQGIVQLEFVSGASVVIEAPAKFELLSPNRVLCSLGKIRAHVPNQAIGFTVETPNYSAVDLGTEFTVQVDPTGESQFHVLQGEVDLRDARPDPSVAPQRLTTGQGMRSSADGELSKLLDSKLAFVGTEQLLELATAALRERYNGWQRFSKQIRSAPNVILYYGFDGHEPWERILKNEGPTKNESLNGAIVGCQWTTGRWQGKQALEFKRTTDRVRVNVPGEYESLTYAAWLRIEGLERWLSSLMLTDGQQPGEVHWQMTDRGQLMLGVKAEPDQSHDFYSPSVIGPKDLGRWVHLACVYNGKEGYVSHVVDGMEVSRENIRIPTTLRIGPAEIGNWVPQDLREHRIRSLNGRVDEFILFNTPLTTEEIHAIYEAGRPQS